VFGPGQNSSLTKRILATLSSRLSLELCRKDGLLLMDQQPPVSAGLSLLLQSRVPSNPARLAELPTDGFHDLVAPDYLCWALARFRIRSLCFLRCLRQNPPTPFFPQIIQQPCFSWRSCHLRWRLSGRSVNSSPIGFRPAPWRRCSFLRLLTVLTFLGHGAFRAGSAPRFSHDLRLVDVLRPALQTPCSLNESTFDSDIEGQSP